MDEINMLDTIDRYLDDKLSPKERTSFELEVNSNSTLNELYQKEVIARASIKELIRQDYKINIAQWTKEVSVSNNVPKKTSTVKTIRTWIAVAASLILLISAYFLINNKNNPQNLINEYAFIADDMRIRGSNEENQLDKALQDYYNESFQSAIVQLENISNNSNVSTTANYYLAHAYLQTHQYEKSEILLTNLLQQNVLPSFINAQKLEWNLILVQAALGNTDKQWESRLDAFVSKNKSFLEKSQDIKKSLNR